MLNPKHYQEFNEVIANFMELKKEENKWISPVNGSKIVNLKYHESWDWIMPVVEKLKVHETKDWYIDFKTDYDNANVLSRGNDWDTIIGNYVAAESTWLLTCYSKCYQLIKWINGYQ